MGLCELIWWGGGGSGGGSCVGGVGGFCHYHEMTKIIGWWYAGDICIHLLGENILKLIYDVRCSSLTHTHRFI